MRGTEGDMLMAVIDDVTIFLQIQRHPEGLSLHGQLAVSNLSPWVDALAQVHGPSGLQATAPVDVTGQFICEPINSDATGLCIISSSGRSILIPGLQF